MKNTKMLPSSASWHKEKKQSATTAKPRRKCYIDDNMLISWQADKIPTGIDVVSFF